jgi:hypothetical protein
MWYPEVSPFGNVWAKYGTKSNAPAVKVIAHITVHALGQNYHVIVGASVT